MNSNIGNPEKYGHRRLVYHFTVPLNQRKTKISQVINKKGKFITESIEIAKSFNVCFVQLLLTKLCV